MRAFSTNKLALFLHLADMYATCNPKRNEYVEEDESQEESEDLPSPDEIVFEKAVPIEKKENVEEPQIHS